MLKAVITQKTYFSGNIEYQFNLYYKNKHIETGIIRLTNSEIRIIKNNKNLYSAIKTKIGKYLSNIIDISDEYGVLNES